MSAELRVFLAATRGVLRALADDHAIAVGTPVFIADLADEDFGPDEVEAAEFDALCEAAARSVALLIDSTDPAQRVVVVARAGVESGLTTSAVTLADLEAVYVDEDAATEDVQALLDAVRAGEEPTDAAFDAVEERHLLWFAPSEIQTL